MILKSVVREAMSYHISRWDGAHLGNIIKEHPLIVMRRLEDDYNHTICDGIYRRGK